MRNKIIDNIRGLCMLGVIGIHIGSLALAPNNFTLYLFLEVLSRYSVPMFFFISGYGLAVTDKGLLTGEPLAYLPYIKKRLKGAGLPYLTWSLFYLVYFYFILPPGYISWNPLHVAFVLFFGLGCYHLYFMVILLWFYGSYPLWRALLRFITRHSITLGLAALFVFQLGMNWWTTHPGINTNGWPVFFKNFFDYRLNYLPLHYLLIFMGGGLAALYWDDFIDMLRRHSWLVITQYIVAVAYDVGSAYEAFTYKGYSLIDLANTYHQLSPQGLVYTVASIIFFCWGLDKLQEATDEVEAMQFNSQFIADNHVSEVVISPLTKLAHRLNQSIALLAANSMLIYFVHPLILDWITSAWNHFGIVMTVKKVTLSYIMLVALSLIASLLLTKLFKSWKLGSLLFTGKK